jgi:hypothetical protein
MALKNSNTDMEIVENTVTIDPEELEAAQQAEAAGIDVGAAVVKLRKPLQYEGKEYKALSFDFDRLTGKDGMLIEREVQLTTGTAVLLPAYNTEYLIRMCAKASLNGIGADAIEALGIRDFNTVIGKARGFLNRSES